MHQCGFPLLMSWMVQEVPPSTQVVCSMLAKQGHSAQQPHISMKQRPKFRQPHAATDPHSPPSQQAQPAPAAAAVAAPL